jgi:hypothetical protein
MLRHRLCPALIGASVLAASPHTAHALRVDYLIDLTAERNDNLLLTPSNPISLTVLRPGVGFEVSHDSSSLR